MSDVPKITVESATGYSDEDGFYVLVIGEDGDVRLRFPTEVAAAHMLAALGPAREWVDARDRQFAAFRRATEAEREKVLGRYEDAGFSVRWDRLVEESAA